MTRPSPTEPVNHIQLGEAIRKVAERFEDTNFIDGMLRLAAMAERGEWTVSGLRTARIQADAIRFATDVSDPNESTEPLLSLGERAALRALAARIESGEVVVP